MKKSFKSVLMAMGLIATMTLGACGETQMPEQNSSEPDVSVTTPESSEPEETETEVPVKTYKVEWVVESKVVETDAEVKENTTPEYNGKTPEKKGTAQYSYTFKGWTPEVGPVNKDTTYTAVFEQVVNKYTVTFNTLGGSKIDAKTEDYGTSIKEPEVKPVKEGYKFVGWALDESGDTPAVFPFELKEDVTLYAIWNVKLDITKHLKTLLSGYDFNPMAYIPEPLQTTYSKNLIANENDAVYDFSNFVNLTTVKSYGYGEQWNMIMDNLNQSMLFFDLLSIVETVSAESIAIFNNYIDKNPSDTASHSFKVGTYDVTIVFDGRIMSYALGLTIKGGTAQIYLTLDTVSGERTGRFQIGEANALRYIVLNNKYEFALRAGGIRRSYFKITRDNQGVVKGQINEHTGLDGKVDLKSAATFTIDKDYAVAIGNKVEGMLGSKKAVAEVYSVKTGHLLGFEVQEDLKGIVYNTMWFNLNDQTGIQTLRIDKTPDEIDPDTGEIVKKGTQKTWINGNTKEFATKTMGLSHGKKALSRRFDIELRKRFYTFKSIDAEGKASYVTKEYRIPMLFVQEEVLPDINADMIAENKGLAFSLNTTTATINKVQTSYDEGIPTFNEIKDTITQEWILDFIGTKFVA